MKKLGLLIAVLVLSFAIVTGTAVMAVEYGDNDIPYDYFDPNVTPDVPEDEIVIDDAAYVTGEDENTAVVVGITVENGSAIIPATVTINDVVHAVTEIAADAFANSTAREIRLPNTITTPVTLDLTGLVGYIFVQPKTTTAVAIPVTGTLEKNPGVYYKGDYNANGETAVGDVISVLQDIAGEGVAGFAALACDVVDSENSKVDVSDVIRILQWLASDSTVLD